MGINAFLLFGRSRGTEDVDVYIERLTREKFLKFHNKLTEAGFWCINNDNTDELFSMLNDNLAIRYAEKEKVIPNMEVKFVKDKIDEITLQQRMKVQTKEGDLYISRIELQIAYKRFILKSEKYLEDALFLQELFDISDEKIINYKHLLQQYGRL